MSTEMIKKHAFHVIVLTSALALSACASQVHSLIPGNASDGRLEHAVSGNGKLVLTYAGKDYEGEFQIKPSRRIEGQHQRHLGHVAHAVHLSALDGDTLVCNMEWPHGSSPGGRCKDPNGASFEVYFQ
jgi:hypothetical protein